MVSLWLTVLISSLLFVVSYIWYKLNFWKRQGVVNEIASVYNRFTKPFHVADQISYKKYGTIVGMYEGIRPSLLLGDVVLIKKVLAEEFHKFPNHRLFYAEHQLAGKNLVALEDKSWRRVRQIVSPIFSTGSLKKMKPYIDESVANLEKNFEKVVNNGKPVNVKDYFSAFSIDVVSSSVFGVKIDSINNPEHSLVKHLRRFFGRHISLKSLLVLWYPFLMKYFDMYLFDYNILVYLNAFLMNIIAEKRKQNEAKSEEKVRKDFLQLLMDAKLETDDYDSKRRTLSVQEIADQGMLFIVAGFDTTSTTLTNTVYCLAVNQNCQNRVYNEIQETMRKHKTNLITDEVLNDLKYLDAVIWESIRHIPAVPRIERRAAEDCYLDDIFIPKDTIITIPCYALNHDEKYFEDPEAFIPDRFLDESHVKNSYAYLPFAVGPRNCIGMRFALLELKTCLASTLSKFKFDICEKTKIPLDFYRGQPVLTAVDITLQITERTSNVTE